VLSFDWQGHPVRSAVKGLLSRIGDKNTLDTSSGKIEMLPFPEATS